MARRRPKKDFVTNTNRVNKTLRRRTNLMKNRTLNNRTLFKKGTNNNRIFRSLQSNNNNQIMGANQGTTITPPVGEPCPPGSFICGSTLVWSGACGDEPPFEQTEQWQNRTPNPGSSCWQTQVYCCSTDPDPYDPTPGEGEGDVTGRGRSR